MRLSVCTSIRFETLSTFSDFNAMRQILETRRLEDAQEPRPFSKTVRRASSLGPDDSCAIPKSDKVT